MNTPPLAPSSHLIRRRQPPAASWTSPAVRPGHRGVAAGADYRALHRSSVTDLEGFWSAVWEYFEVEAATPFEHVLAEEAMPAPAGSPVPPSTAPTTPCADCGTTLRRILALDETGARYEVSGGLLRAQLASVASTLRDLGVGSWDRVVGYLPSPPARDRGLPGCREPRRGVVGGRAGLRGQGDRRPVRPARTTVLITSDGYRFNGTTYDRRVPVPLEDEFTFGLDLVLEGLAGLRDGD